MLGKTAGGLYWMFRFLERSENIARLIEAGSRIALTRSSDPASEWQSVIITAGVGEGFEAKHSVYNCKNVSDYLLRDTSNQSSVISIVDNARMNARLVRTALTTEVWETVNETWITLKDLLRKPVKDADLPEVLGVIRKQSALVRGAVYGTMLRNDAFDFAQIGVALERADSMARMIDVKYYALLPSSSSVGSSLDNAQWEMLLRSASAHRSFNWINGNDMTSAKIVEFFIFDPRFPRSFVFCLKMMCGHFEYLEQDDASHSKAHLLSVNLLDRLKSRSVDSIFDEGLHDFIRNFIVEINSIGIQIEQDFRFNG